MINLLFETAIPGVIDKTKNCYYQSRSFVVHDSFYCRHVSKLGYNVMYESRSQKRLLRKPIK